MEAIEHEPRCLMGHMVHHLLVEGGAWVVCVIIPPTHNHVPQVVRVERNALGGEELGAQDGEVLLLVWPVLPPISKLALRHVEVCGGLHGWCEGGGALAMHVGRLHTTPHAYQHPTPLTLGERVASPCSKRPNNCMSLGAMGMAWGPLWAPYLWCIATRLAHVWVAPSPSLNVWK